jgi:hypothetical protein
MNGIQNKAFRQYVNIHLNKYYFMRPGSARFFFSPQSPDRLCVSPNLLSNVRWVPGALSPAVKRQVREADHSPPSNAEVKNGGAISPLPHMFSYHRT